MIKPIKFLKAFLIVVVCLTLGVITFGAIFAAFHFSMLYPQYSIPTVLLIFIGSLTYAVAQEL